MKARKKGRAEVQTVRNALTKMGGHREIARVPGRR